MFKIAEAQKLKPAKIAAYTVLNIDSRGHLEVIIIIGSMWNN